MESTTEKPIKVLCCWRSGINKSGNTAHWSASTRPDTTAAPALEIAHYDIRRLKRERLSLRLRTVGAPHSLSTIAGLSRMSRFPFSQGCRAFSLRRFVTYYRNSIIKRTNLGMSCSSSRSALALVPCHQLRGRRSVQHSACRPGPAAPRGGSSSAAVGVPQLSVSYAVLAVAA